MTIFFKLKMPGQKCLLVLLKTMRGKLKIGLFQDIQDITSHYLLILYSAQRGIICQNSQILVNYLKPRVFVNGFPLFALFIYCIWGRAFCIPLLLHLYLISPKEKKAPKLFIHV